mmetsp:Transcript_75994/g.137140  ORF Transcript_75994/g.137140 Transcript_75994/m.137140 type:complete len:238 (+) Transcript_75994:4346-5059(+)
MAAELSQTNHQLQELSQSSISNNVPALEDGPIPGSLHAAEWEPDFVRNPWGQRDDILLLPPEHKHGQHRSDLVDQQPINLLRAHIFLLPLIQDCLGLSEELRQLDGIVKDLRFCREHIWPEELEQCVELCQVVLQGSASEQQPTGTVEGVHDLADPGALILNPMRLVQNNHRPAMSLEVILRRRHGLVGRDDDVLHAVPDPIILETVFALLLTSAHLGHAEVRHEALCLTDPVPSTA